MHISYSQISRNQFLQFRYCYNISIFTTVWYIYHCQYQERGGREGDEDYSTASSVGKHQVLASHISGCGDDV
jgi:hypothetical protein